MQVEVNETNIDKFNLVELTGNAREDLLSRAAEASVEGYVLSCEVPDDQVLEQNVFEVYESEHVDPRRLNGCGYEQRQDFDGGLHWICVTHGKTSRRDVNADPHAPCIQVDPDVRPDAEEFKKAFSEVSDTCVYNKIDDPQEGTIYICVHHGQPSKHDISRVPSQPCLVIDPLTPADRE